ncbi:unnamed protein product, partial [Heterobilharzia americana]
MPHLSLFDPIILHFVSSSELVEKVVTSKIIRNSGVSLRIRPLSSSDYGYVVLLKQLTTVGDISKAKFDERFSQMISCPGTYFIIVLEDERTGRLIGAATLLVELKFIHTCSKRGHIEDVVVDSEFRGMNLGKLLVDTLVRIGKHIGCY